MEFDRVIVAAGAQGCVIASRPTEDPATAVRLVEEGGANGDAFRGNRIAALDRFVAQTLHDNSDAHAKTRPR